MHLIWISSSDRPHVSMTYASDAPLRWYVALLCSNEYKILFQCMNETGVIRKQLARGQKHLMFKGSLALGRGPVLCNNSGVCSRSRVLRVLWAGVRSAGFWRRRPSGQSVISSRAVNIGDTGAQWHWPRAMMGIMVMSEFLSEINFEVMNTRWIFYWEISKYVWCALSNEETPDGW